MINFVDRKSYMNRFPIYIYIFCVIICLTFSFVFHTFYPISKTVNDVLQRLDMAGISFLIFGTSYSVMYYVFQCREDLYNFYTITGGITCGLSFVINLLPSMHTPQNKALKGLIFLTTGCINFIALAHAMYIGII